MCEKRVVCASVSVCFLSLCVSGGGFFVCWLPWLRVWNGMGVGFLILYDVFYFYVCVCVRIYKSVWLFVFAIWFMYVSEWIFVSVCVCVCCRDYIFRVQNFACKSEPNVEV